MAMDYEIDNDLVLADGEDDIEDTIIVPSSQEQTTPVTDGGYQLGEIDNSSKDKSNSYESTKEVASRSYENPQDKEDRISRVNSFVRSFAERKKANELRQRSARNVAIATALGEMLGAMTSHWISGNAGSESVVPKSNSANLLEKYNKLVDAGIADDKSFNTSLLNYQRALDQETLRKEGKVGVAQEKTNTEKVKGDNTDKVYGWKRLINQDTLASKEGIADANNKSKKEVADANNQTKKDIKNAEIKYKQWSNEGTWNNNIEVAKLRKSGDKTTIINRFGIDDDTYDEMIPLIGLTPVKTKKSGIAGVEELDEYTIKPQNITKENKPTLVGNILGNFKRYRMDATNEDDRQKYSIIAQALTRVDEDFADEELVGLAKLGVEEGYSFTEIVKALRAIKKERGQND